MKPESDVAGPDTLAALILRSARQWPDAESVLISGCRWTFGALVKRSIQVAGALRASGLKRGDRIGLMPEDSPEYLELVLGAALIGVVPVLFNEVSRGAHLQMLLGSLNLKMLFASGSGDMDPGAVIDGIDLRVIRVGQGAPDERTAYTSLIAAGSNFSDDDIAGEVAALKAEDPLVILFTSGVTTGVPKSCTLSNLDILSTIGPFTERTQLRSGSRIWIPLHMFQVGFFAPLAAAFAVGATVITSRKFEPAAALKLIALEKVTHAYPIYPSFWLPVIYNLDFFPSDFAALTHVVLLGPMTLLRRVQRLLPHCSVMNNYGGAEHRGGMCLPFDNDPAEIRLGAVGRPYEGYQLRIVNPKNGKVCRPGEIGEIQILLPSGPKKNEASGSSYSQDGWLQTSDLGSISADKVLYFHGRFSEMMSIGGRHLSCARIEEILSAHPAVCVAQVIAVNDPEAGQFSAAFVELRPGYSATEAELLETCKNALDETQVPRGITFVSDWPMSASKIQKHLLIDLIAKSSGELPGS
jgi:fatty-acyl-CoA synthase